MGHPPLENENDLQESLDKVLGIDEGENFEDSNLLEENWEQEEFVEEDPSQVYEGEEDLNLHEVTYQTPSPRVRDQAPPSGPGAGGAALWGGLFLLVLGIAYGALNVLGKGSELLGSFQAIGLEPSMLFLSGLVLILIGKGQGKASRNLLENLQENLQHGNREIEGLLQELRDAQQRSSQTQTATAPGDVQIALTKLENMMVSLTKATRMYNKPLVDLVSMMTDQGKELEEIRSDLEGLEKAMAENAVTAEKKFEGLVERLRGDTQELEEIFEKSREALLGELKPFVGQKADQAGEKLQLKLGEDRRILQETFENLGASLESKIKEALSKTPTQGSDTDQEALQRLESSLNSLFEVVQKIEQEGVKASGMVGAAAASAPAQPASQNAPASRPAQNTQPTVGTVSTQDSGIQPAGGRTKKVMSAIEKLKQLRGDG